MLHPTISFYHKARLDCLRGIEIWTPVYIKPYNKTYKASNFGHFRNSQTGYAISSANHTSICLSRGKHHGSISIGKTVYFSFHPSNNCNRIIDHQDQNKTNNVLTNLYVAPKITPEKRGSLGTPVIIISKNLRKTEPSIRDAAKLIHKYLPQKSVQAIRGQIQKRTVHNRLIKIGNFNISRLTTRNVGRQRVIKLVKQHRVLTFPNQKAATHWLIKACHLCKKPLTIREWLSNAIHEHQLICGFRAYRLSESETLRFKLPKFNRFIRHKFGTNLHVTKLFRNQYDNVLMARIYDSITGKQLIRECGDLKHSNHLENNSHCTAVRWPSGSHTFKRQQSASIWIAKHQPSTGEPASAELIQKIMSISLNQHRSCCIFGYTVTSY